MNRISHTPSDLQPDELAVAQLLGDLPRLDASPRLREACLREAGLPEASTRPTPAGRMLQFPSAGGFSAGGWAVAALVLVGLGALALLAAPPSSGSDPAKTVRAPLGHGTASEATQSTARRTPLRVVADPSLALFHSDETLTGLGVDPDDFLAVGDR